MEMSYSQLEGRVRSALKREGLALQKSRARSVSNPNFGTYRVINPMTNTVVSYAGSITFGLYLEEVADAWGVSE